MHIFKENEIPVADLHAVGLHDGNTPMLSEDVKEQLLRGQVTDFVTLKNIPVNDEKLDIDTKLSLQQTENGTSLLFHPIYAKEQKHTLLSEDEQENFKNGVHVKNIAAYGKLVEYGDAPYQFDQKNKESFYIRLEKSDGQTKDLWGIDLRNALENSGHKKGDSIQINHLGTTQVKTEVFERDENNKVVGSKWIDAQRNNWKIEDYDITKEKENAVLFEYDRDTKSYVGKNTKNVVAPEEVNGIELTPEQKRKYKEGEEVTLSDDTKIQASPISNMKFNRRLAILSVLFDGGLTYLLLKATDKMVEKNNITQQAYTDGYREAMNKIKADLTNKQEAAPNSQKIANDLNIINKEISLANISAPAVNASKSIYSMKEKVNDPELERNAVEQEHDLKEEKGTNYKADVKIDNNDLDQSTGRKR